LAGGLKGKRRVLLHDIVARGWDELVARPAGLRFILQLVAACIFAIRDGVNDAKAHRASYFWTVHRDWSRRRKSAGENLRAGVRVLAAGAILDTLYQYVELGAVRPLETVAIVLVLGFVPYVIARGPASRIAKRVMGIMDETHSLHRG
jgi:hypothetical protein